MLLFLLFSLLLFSCNGEWWRAAEGVWWLRLCMSSTSTQLTAAVPAHIQTNIYIYIHTIWYIYSRNWSKINMCEMHLTAYIVTICIVIGPTCCVTRRVFLPVPVSVCVRVFLCCSWRPLANLASMTHTPTSPITKQHKKGEVHRKRGRRWKKNNFGSCILHLQKVQTQCVSVFLEKLLVHTPTQRHTHTHAVCTGCNVPKFKLKHPFFIPYATHYQRPPPLPCSDNLPVPTLASQFFTISVLFSFMTLLFFCFCPPLVVF